MGAMQTTRPSVSVPPPEGGWRRLDLPPDAVRTASGPDGAPVTAVSPEAFELLAREAFRDVSFFLRQGHLRRLAAILDDPEAGPNDRFMARIFLENAAVSAAGELPLCQDTGTAVIIGERGARVWTGFDEREPLARGVRACFAECNLRHSQVAPLSMFEERNTGSNLPAQIDLGPGDDPRAYRFTFIAKGGGSANKTFLFQKTRSLLEPRRLEAFLRDEIPRIGTAACPPYRLAVIIGGTSAETNLKYVKLASAGALDHLPETGDETGRPFRDRAWEERVLRIARETGLGAQFGGKYFCLEARVIRLSRHAASCPVGIGVSCVADRNIRGLITPEGVFLERLETEPARFLPPETADGTPPPLIDLSRPMEEIRSELSRYPVRTRLRLSGPLIVARDAAHARLLRRIEEGLPLPDYFKDHPVYYAGPARTPPGKPSGSFGPTTAQRMDPYVEPFMARGGSLVMLAKGNRSPAVTEACRKYGGFYLGVPGGPAALLAERHIRSIETLDFEDLGMEAVRRIVVEDFPAFLLIDDKGNDFFAEIAGKRS